MTPHQPPCSKRGGCFDSFVRFGAWSDETHCAFYFAFRGPRGSAPYENIRMPPRTEPISPRHLPIRGRRGFKSDTTPTKLLKRIVQAGAIVGDSKLDRHETRCLHTGWRARFFYARPSTRASCFRLIPTEKAKSCPCAAPLRSFGPPDAGMRAHTTRQRTRISGICLYL